LPAFIKTIQCTYILSFPDGKLAQDTRPMTVTITDGNVLSRETSRYAFDVILPTLSESTESSVADAKLIESINGAIIYDGGFNKLYTASFCATRDTKTGEWTPDNCAVGPTVDFNRYPMRK